MLRNIERC